MTARGDAAVTASVFHDNALTQFVIADGKDTNSTILPISAGLTKFWPMPPKNCLTTMMATTEPMAAIHSGMDTGRLNARIRPVTTALKSPRVPGLFITLRAMYSDSMAVPTVTPQTASTR